MADKREGRGRLSSIEQLPPEADPDIQWAVQQLIARERTQADILFELNDRLAVLGIEPISSSAFNRYSMRRAALTRRLEETRQVSKAVVEAVGHDSADDMTIALVQLIKDASMELLEDGKLNSKSLMELARALSAAMTAQKQSAANLEAENARQRAKLETAAQAAAESIVKARPDLDGAHVLGMIRSAYGIEEDA